MEGTPEEDGLLQSIRPAEEAFQNAIRATTPDFRPYKKPETTPTCRGGCETSQVVSFSFLSNEEDPGAPPQDDGAAIYIDEVMSRAQR